MSHVAIRSTGSALPAQVLDNAELIARFALPVDAAWIESRTGIRSRHWLGEGETTSDLAVRAAETALARGGVEARELDRIVLATISPDRPSPATALTVARHLGARCAAFDVSAACAGFLYGLDLGAAAVRAGERNVLVIAADARSRWIDTQDVRSVVLFADGAGAALLGPADRPGLSPVVLGAEGRASPGAHVPAGGTARPASRATVEAREHFLVVDSRQEIFELFVRFTREAVERLLERTRSSLDEVDLFITHQGNSLMVKAVLEDLGIEPARAVDNVAEHGNTSGATVPIALDEALRDGRLGPGKRALLTSVGAGYTFGAVLHDF